MNEIKELDPRVKSFEKAVKYGGAALVAVAAATIVTITSAGIAVAGITVLVGLAVVNFVVPVGSRWLALKKQQSLTKLAEDFSEETIREDELNEGRRIGVLEGSYKTSRAELEGLQEELRDQMETATAEERDLLESRVRDLQGVIDEAEATLRQRKADFAELQRVNKVYIALHRTAGALERGHGAERNPEELQRIETSRNSIKTRMRAAMAGKTIEAMNQQLQRKPDISKIARIGHSEPAVISAVATGGKQHVPIRR